MNKYVLITNLSYVTVGDVRTDTHALLLEEWSEELKALPRRRIRGFGPDAAWPVFDIITVPSVAYALTAAAASSAWLQLNGGPRLNLYVSDQSKPIDVLAFTPGTDIEEVWRVLPQKVAAYWWPSYTNMPRLVWVPSAAVRAGLVR